MGQWFKAKEIEVAGPQQKNIVRPTPQKPGLFAGQDPNRRCVGSKYANFFAQNYEPVAKMADQYGNDATLPLGLASFESGWGLSRMAQEQNNPHGTTPDGKTGRSFSSIPTAWDFWGRQWGPRVRDFGGDQALFIRRLLEDNRKKKGAIDHHGAYNSEHPLEWASGVAGGVASVRKRLEDWKKYRC
ncbi:hypothetical protein [Sphingomonas sp.]|uniref:hypothetical protein n=1 Tax=Sphingomonas sp. TaxID=28214 RepID=UPI003B3AD17A